MRRVVVLGSTGSIGVQTLDIVLQHRDRLEVVGLAARSNSTKLLEQAKAHGVKRLALFDRNDAGIPSGMDAIVDLATMPEADVVVVSVAGVIGLVPTVAAIDAGKDIALASKEVLVAAGELIMPMISRAGVKLTPIDSEHSAIFQCLQGYTSDQVSKLILTASGGPFRGKTRADLGRVTVEDALNHPTWRMGGKITIDSATLMNKGLETIEAKWLFDLDIDQVQTIVHPQSVVHSMVEFKDGSVLGQFGWPDMRLPLAYALLHPERKPNSLKTWSPLDTPNLTFEPVDHATFPSIRLAIQASKVGGTMPCAMNAANEVAANAFLEGKTRFLQIPEIVRLTMEEHTTSAPTLEGLLAVDERSREIARNHIEEFALAR